jgi:1-acyl-sn-glycerol-3-phosphate acyltransferase
MEFKFHPARDLGLGLGERLRSTRREGGMASLLMHVAWRRLVSLYLSVFHRLEILGRENFPATPPFIVVANHNSHLDALALTAALPPRLARDAFALAAGEFFFATLPAAGFAAFAINALPIWRKHTTADDLAFLRQRLEEDRLIFLLFPEGTRSRTGAMAQFRPGIGALVAGGDVPVVPCFLQGAHEAWPPERKLPSFRKLRLTIGTPLTFLDTSNERSGWLHVAAACEAAVRGLAT